MQVANREGSVIGVMNIDSIGIWGVLGICLYKRGHGYIRIVNNIGLGKVSLIHYKMIS